MTQYKAPIRDMRFLLHEHFQIGRYADLPGFEDASEDLVNAILDEGAKLAEEVLHPLNKTGDEEGCTRHPDGRVTTPSGFKEAYRTIREGGWIGLTFPSEYGGQGLPHAIGICFDEMVETANLAFSMYQGLTRGAAAALLELGSEGQKRTFLPHMVSGAWTGTMNLTEPHCGTDLGMLKTTAEPQADGSYKITGTKIFISAGEHDLSENIIHMVLARTPGAPKGTKGISLFIVPKFLVNSDGSLGARNAVSCGSIEHKMGINGNATCVMNYDGATGYLMGEENKGLAAMFVMMNAARLGVGVQGLAQSVVSYQNAVSYANDRIQGRSLTGAKNPEKAADPIIVHPDVRRMLMEAKAFNEAARATILWTALNLDLERHHPDAGVREKASDFVALFTPIIKGVFTDLGYQNATNAQQVFGGHGYIKEWGMDQFVRDARITMIYEGANGIQALDLVGRKLAMNGGRALRSYFGLVQETVARHSGDARLKDFTDALTDASGHLQKATGWLMQNAMTKPENAGAGSTAYMHLLGLVVMGHMWTEMAATAQGALDRGENDRDFYEHKLATGRYFAKRAMKRAVSLCAEVEAGADILMALPAEAF